MYHLAIAYSTNESRSLSLTAPRLHVSAPIVSSVLLKKERKTRDVFTCVKFMFITCDKKVNIVNFFVCTISVALYSVAVLGMG